MLNNGTVLDGKYTIEASLGHGYYAEVYRARDNATREPVAVKVIKAEHQQAAQMLRTLSREKEALRLLAGHPAIIAWKGEGVLGNPGQQQSYLVLEFLHGDSLVDRLRTQPMDERRGLEIALRLADVLAYAHQEGIVHNDVKPDHVYLLPDGGIKVIDWNVARFYRPGDTPRFAFPSDREEDWQRAVRGEVFDFGAFLYNLFTGRKIDDPTRPVERTHTHGSKGKEGFVRNDRGKKIPWPLTFAGALGLDEETEDIVRVCANPDPKERYPSIQEIHADLAARAQALGLDVAGLRVPVAPRPARRESDQERQFRSLLQRINLLRSQQAWQQMYALINEAYGLDPDNVDLPGLFVEALEHIQEADRQEREAEAERQRERAEAERREREAEAERQRERAEADRQEREKRERERQERQERERRKREEDRRRAARWHWAGVMASVVLLGLLAGLLFGRGRPAPGGALGPYNQGVLLYQQDRFAEASASLEKAVQKWPGRVEYRWWLAKSYEKMERSEDAAKQCREILRREPNGKWAGYARQMLAELER